MVNFTFLIRVINAFKGSLIDIKSNNIKLQNCLNFAILVEFILYFCIVCCNILYELSLFEKEGNIFLLISFISAMLVMIIHVILIIFLLIFFIKQLRILYSFATGIPNVTRSISCSPGDNVQNNTINNNNDMNISNTSQMSLKFVKIATKTYVCFIISVISTGLCFLLLLLFAPLGQITLINNNTNQHFWFVISFTMFNIDSALNAICLTLQWPFASNIYYILCKNTNNKTIKRFLKQFNHKNETIAMTLFAN